MKKKESKLRIYATLLIGMGAMAWFISFLHSLGMQVDLHALSAILIIVGVILLQYSHKNGK